MGLALACATGTIEEGDETETGGTGGGAQSGSGGNAGTVTGQGGASMTGGSGGSGGTTGGTGGSVSSGGTGGGASGGVGGSTGGTGGSGGAMGGANAVQVGQRRANIAGDRQSQLAPLSRGQSRGTLGQRLSLFPGKDQEGHAALEALACHRDVLRERADVEQRRHPR